MEGLHMEGAVPWQFEWVFGEWASRVEARGPVEVVATLGRTYWRTRDPGVKRRLEGYCSEMQGSVSRLEAAAMRELVAATEWDYLATRVPEEACAAHAPAQDGGS